VQAVSRQHALATAWPMVRPARLEGTFADPGSTGIRGIAKNRPWWLRSLQTTLVI